MSKPDIDSQRLNTTSPNQFEIDLAKPERAVEWHPQFAVAALTLIPTVASAATALFALSRGREDIAMVGGVVALGVMGVGQVAEIIVRKRYGEPRV